MGGDSLDLLALGLVLGHLGLGFGNKGSGMFRDTPEDLRISGIFVQGFGSGAVAGKLGRFQRETFQESVPE